MLSPLRVSTSREEEQTTGIRRRIAESGIVPPGTGASLRTQERQIAPQEPMALVESDANNERWRAHRPPPDGRTAPSTRASMTPPSKVAYISAVPAKGALSDAGVLTQESTETREQQEQARLVQGSANIAGFDDVVREHGSYLWRLLRRLGVREADVDDVWQETFIVVHRNLGGFEGRSSLRTWLSSIAIRVVSDYRNRAHRRHEQTTDEVPDGGQPATQDQTLLQKQRLAVLDKLLRELKPEQREVLVLYEFGELPMSEVARAVGCPVQTAYSRLNAAKRFLETSVKRFAATQGAQ